jgi:hypothetical protein
MARLIAQPDDLICIAGSFFLAAELRPLLAIADRAPANRQQFDGLRSAGMAARTATD